jgi:hypothetical protein
MMAFAINETGFERGATKLVFGTAPIMLERHAEDAQDAAYAVAISGEPITVQYVRTQAKSFLRIRLRLVVGSDVTTLIALMDGAGPVDVKLTPGSAAITQCMFGPREDQELIPYNEDYATGKPDGTAVDPIFTQYKADLFLLRL